VLLFGLVTGLRERKKAATRAAIHDAAMELFDEQGFSATTIDRIADAADVSRATVFSYFPSKEDIVFGDAPLAIEALAAALRERAGGDAGAFGVVRGWLGQLAGWLEPGLVLQLRLVREVPVVAARRLQHYGEMERVIADALADDLGPGRELAARLAAASLMAALRIVEESAVAHMEEDGRALTEPEIAALLDDAVTFARAGIAAV